VAAVSACIILMALRAAFMKVCLGEGEILHSLLIIFWTMTFSPKVCFVLV